LDYYLGMVRRLPCFCWQGSPLLCSSKSLT